MPLADSPIMDALVRGLRFKVERGVIPYRDALNLLITAAGLSFCAAVQALEDSNDDSV